MQPREEFQLRKKRKVLDSKSELSPSEIMEMKRIEKLFGDHGCVSQVGDKRVPVSDKRYSLGNKDDFVFNGIQRQKEREQAQQENLFGNWFFK